MVTKKCWIVRKSKSNQKSIRRQKRFALFTFALFWAFLGQKWTKKRPDPFFLDLCECGIMSYMICQKVEKFSLQNMAREAISLVWGVWPLNRGPGTPGGSEDGKFSLPPTFGHRASTFSRKKWGVKIFPHLRSVWLRNSLLKVHIFHLTGYCLS